MKRARERFLLRILLSTMLVIYFSISNVRVVIAQEEESVLTQWVDPDGREPSPKPPPPPLSLDAPISVYEPKIPGRPYVYVLINKELYWNIADELNRYISDLDVEDIDVHAVALNGTTHPSTIRSMIQNEHSQGAVGCLLVGEILAAWYEMSNPSPWGYEQFPTDLYYMDLDGIWADIDNDGLYDYHSGDQEPEIWVGRLKAPNMATDELSLMKNYFEKNHLYRTGSLSLPERALIYVDDDWVGYGESYIDSAVASIFDDRTLVTDSATTSAADYLDRLQEGYYLVHLMAHGSAHVHAFKPSAGYVRSSEIYSADPKAFFFLLYSCSNARYTENNYIAGSYVFSGTYGLAAISSTKTGGMLGDQHFYSSFSGQNLGFAFKSWLTQVMGRSESYDKWFYGMAIIGDPTLTLVPSLRTHDVAVLCVSPSTDEVVPGEPVTIDVTVENQGSVPEIVDINCFSTTKRRPLGEGVWVIAMTWIDIDQQQVMLDPGMITTLTLTWDTSGLEAGWFYDISVRADLAFDSDSDDNFYYLPYPYAEPLPVLRFVAESPVNILVTAPNGQRVGYDSTTGSSVIEIEGAIYSGPGTEPQIVTIPSPLPGVYIIDRFGTGVGAYAITIESIGEDGSLVDSQTWTGTAIPGELERGSIHLFEDGSFVDMPHGVIPEVPWGTVMASAIMIIALVAYVTMPKWRRKREYINP